MRRFAIAACAFQALTLHAAVAGRLTSFDMPGQTAICGAGIADDDTVVGHTLNTTGPMTNFFYRMGAFTPLSTDFARGQTAATGINRGHAVVGTNALFSRNFTLTAKGFLLRNGVTHVVHITGAADVYARAIGSDGTIVGSYDIRSNAPLLGFLKRGESVTTLDDGSGTVEPVGLDAGGTHIVGFSGSIAAGSISGWEYVAGKFTPIDVAGAVATLPTGINNAGTISGSYWVQGTTATTIHGFLYDAGTFTLYDVPGASLTQLTGINAHGVVTGCYTDGNGTHGLIYRP